MMRDSFSAVARFGRNARDQGVTLRFAAGGSLPARFDHDRIVQVVDNLLSNALRHATAGPPGDRRAGGVIEVRLSGTDGEGGGTAASGPLRLEVENSGDQVPEEFLPNLFEPFYRVDASRARGSGGSGLGLAVVRSIALAHGGNCGARNVPGGFLVRVEIPSISTR